LSAVATIRRFAGKLTAAALGGLERASAALPPSDAKLPSKKPVNKGAKQALKRDPRSLSGHVVAGPPEDISANVYHCATVGAGWAMAEAERSNAAHWRAAAKGERGYRRPDAPQMQAERVAA
jgi:hypothetical protein